jgi:hypothetical protein
MFRAELEMPATRALSALRIKLVSLLPPKQAVWLRVVRVAIARPPPQLAGGGGPPPHPGMMPGYGPGVMLPPPALMMMPRPLMMPPPALVDPGYIEQVIGARMQQMAMVLERMVGGRMEAGLNSVQAAVARLEGRVGALEVQLATLSAGATSATAGARGPAAAAAVVPTAPVTDTPAPATAVVEAAL